MNKCTKGEWTARTDGVFAGKNCIAICDTDNAGPRRYRANARMMAASKDLLVALKAIGTLPEGYCFCSVNRDATRPDDEHQGECRDARAAILKAQEDTNNG